MNLYVDPIGSPAAWEAYVLDALREGEKVLFSESRNLEGIKDHAAFLRVLTNLIDREAQLFIGLTLSWPPKENPSIAQMQATVDALLEHASRRCFLRHHRKPLPVQLNDLPMLVAAHLYPGHAHLHAALCLVHPYHRKVVSLNKGWEVCLFQDALRHAELSHGWSPDPDAPRYIEAGSRLVRVPEQPTSFRLTPAQRRMEWLYGECAKRLLWRTLRPMAPERFQSFDEFEQKLRQLECSYFERKRDRRWVFQRFNEQVTAFEVGHQWEFTNLPLLWQQGCLHRVVGLDLQQQVRRRQERLRVDGRITPAIVAPIERLEPTALSEQLEQFCGALAADKYRVILRDAEGTRTPLTAPGGALNFTAPELSNSYQALEWKMTMLNGKTVLIVPEKKGCLPLPLSGLSQPACRALLEMGYTPAAIVKTGPTKDRSSRSQEGNYTALLWAESLDDVARDYNSGRRLLAQLGELFHIRTRPFPGEPIPCPHLYQTAEHGDQCLVERVTGQTCAKTTQLLRACWQEFEREEDIWKLGALATTARAINDLPAAPSPHLALYEAHLRELSQVPITRCDTREEVDTRIAVRLLSVTPRDTVQAVIEVAARFLPNPLNQASSQAYATKVVGEAARILSVPLAACQSEWPAWQDTTATARRRALKEEEEEEDERKKRQVQEQLPATIPSTTPVIVLPQPAEQTECARPEPQAK